VNNESFPFGDTIFISAAKELKVALASSVMLLLTGLVELVVTLAIMVEFEVAFA